MAETDYKEIKKSILQKKKQGMDEKEIMKFLELSGYPLRLLEEVNREFEQGTGKKTEQEKEANPLITRITGSLFGLTSLIELFYFFMLFPEESYGMNGIHFIPMLVLIIFVILSFLLAYGLFFKRYWSINYAPIIIFFRMLLLGYFILIKYEFFIFIIILDIILAAVLLLIKPLFEETRLKSEQEKMMDEVEKHKEGKDKKEIWEN